MTYASDNITCQADAKSKQQSGKKYFSKFQNPAISSGKEND